jgi:hypothetical protein
MAGMGRPPKPDAQRRRRNATVPMTRLPPDGRPGPPPAWPLVDDVRLTAQRDLARAEVKRLLAVLDDAPGRAEAAAANRKLAGAQERLAVLNAQLRAQRRLERAVWVELWATPQAAEWERLRWTREVAQYVRHRVLGELGSLDDAKEARQQADRLGLTPLALLRLRWTVGEAEEPAADAPPPPAEGTVRRLRAVD